MKARKTSVAIIVIITIVTVTTLLICGLWVLINKIASDRWWTQLHKEQAILADQLSESLAAPLWNFDNSQVGEIIESAMKDEDVFGIVVKTTGGRPRIYARMRDAHWRIINVGYEFPTKGLLVEERDIRSSNDLIGKVEVIATPKFLESFLRYNRVLIVSIAISFELLLALILYLLLWRIVLKPLKEVEAYAVAVSSGIAEGSNIETVQFRGELEGVRSSIKKMVSLLGARYAELQDEVKRRREMERALQGEKEFTDTAVNALLGLFYVVDEQGRYIRWNNALTAIVGKTDEEMLLRDSLELVHPDDRGRIAARLAEVFEKGYVEDEARIVVKGGQDTRYFLLNGKKMTVDGRRYVVGSAIDITERKLAEEALKKSEERFLKFFRLAPVGMTVSSLPEGRLLDVNQEFERMLGFARNEAVGKTTIELGVWLDPQDRENIIQIIRREGKIKDLDLQIRAKQGHIITQRFSAEPIEIDGQAYLLSAFADVTRQKLAEEELKDYHASLEELVEARTAELSAANKKLRELDNLKSMFIASMSHELRTPLNSIIGFTGMTLEGLSGVLNEEQKDNLTRAYFSAKHLLNLISDVIDISKIEAGRVEAYPEEFSLREIVDDAAATIEPQLKDKGLTLEVDVPPETNLYTDRKRLLQCLINFLSNAVKYTERGEITVASLITNGHMALSVTDTGIGIAEKDIPRLFEPFERLDTHLRVKAGGTGLGLYLTKKLVSDVLHGDVSVGSVEGKGSTFAINIPMDIRESKNASEGDTL